MLFVAFQTSFAATGNKSGKSRQMAGNGSAGTSKAPAYATDLSPDSPFYFANAQMLGPPMKLERMPSLGAPDPVAYEVKLIAEFDAGYERTGAGAVTKRAPLLPSQILIEPAAPATAALSAGDDATAASSAAASSVAAAAVAAGETKSLLVTTTVGNTTTAGPVYRISLPGGEVTQWSELRAKGIAADSEGNYYLSVGTGSLSQSFLYQLTSEGKTIRTVELTGQFDRIACDWSGLVFALDCTAFVLHVITPEVLLLLALPRVARAQLSFAMVCHRARRFPTRS